MLNTGRIALVALLFLSAGCGASQYELPPLPPESTWQHVELNPVSVERNDTANSAGLRQDSRLRLVPHEKQSRR